MWARRFVFEPEGDRCWISLDKGAFPFVVLFMYTFGSDAIHIISKTNEGTWHSWHKGVKIEHWVVRFLRQTLFPLGLKAKNVDICSRKTGWNGKGPAAKKAGLTHMVDNDMECLWAVLLDDTENAGKTIMNFNGEPPGMCIRFCKHEDVLKDWPHDFEDYLSDCSSWFELAEYFSLPHLDLWDEIAKMGPPVQRAPEKLAVDIVTDLLTRGTGSPDTGSPRPPVGGGGSPPPSLDPGSAVSSHAANAMIKCQDEQIKQLMQQVQAMQTQMGEMAAAQQQATAAALRQAQQATAAAEDAHRNAAVAVEAAAREAAKEAAEAAAEAAAKVAAKAAAEAVKSAASDGGSRKAASSRGASPPPPPQAPQAPPPVGPPNWSHWRAAQTQGEGWLIKKQRRAERHRAGYLPPPGAAALPAPDMCRGCGKNQPGRHCVMGVCRSCCHWYRWNTQQECWQHDD